MLEIVDHSMQGSDGIELQLVVRNVLEYYGMLELELVVQKMPEDNRMLELPHGSHQMSEEDEVIELPCCFYQVPHLVWSGPPSELQQGLKMSHLTCRRLALGSLGLE